MLMDSSASCSLLSTLKHIDRDQIGIHAQNPAIDTIGPIPLSKAGDYNSQAVLRYLDVEMLYRTCVEPMTQKVVAPSGWPAHK